MTPDSPSSSDSHLSERCDDPGSSTLTQCILCKRKDRQMMRYQSLTTQVRDFITTNFGETILNEKRVCKKHVLEIKRKCRVFIINIRPLQRTKTIESYAVLLFNQVAVRYFQSGTTEVH